MWQERNKDKSLLTTVNFSFTICIYSCIYSVFSLAYKANGIYRDEHALLRDQPLQDWLRGDTTAQPCQQCRPERMMGNRHPLKAAKLGQMEGGEAVLESSRFLILLKRGTTVNGATSEFNKVAQQFCSKVNHGPRHFHTNSWIRSRMVCRQMGQVFNAALHSMQEACPHWKTSLMWLSMQMGQVIRSSICLYRDCSCSSRLCCSEFSVLGLQSTSVWSVRTGGECERCHQDLHQYKSW